MKFKLRKKEVSGGGPNTIRYTTYAPNAYGFKGGKVLARRAGSGGDIEEQILAESTSMDDDMLGHLTHAYNLPHEAPQHAGAAVELLHQFHNLRQGKPSSITATHKHDGGASVHIIHDEKGVGVSDKHRMARGVVSRSNEDIDKHFGHQPEYASSLKHLLNHGKELVNKGHHVQGDLLWAPNDKHVKKIAGTTKYTPNRITYHAKTNSPMGVAIHTEISNGIAHGVSDRATNKTKNVFVPEHKFKPEASHYSEENKKGFETHLNAAKELMKNNPTHHLTPEHNSPTGHFTIYANRTNRSGEKATVSGYISHLKSEGEKAAGKMKSQAGQEKKRSQFQSLITHVNNNKEHFQRTLDIRHHMIEATKHVLGGVQHSDIHASIDGKKTPEGEGIVIGKNIKGKDRPLVKLVHPTVSKAILNNPRFGRGP